MTISSKNGIGILLLDEEEPFVVGDPGNPDTFTYSVIHRVVEGATIKRVFANDESLIPAFEDAARELQDKGIRAISGCCGMFAQYQSSVADAVDVPVALSSLQQVPLILNSIGAAKRLGILVGSKERIPAIKDLLKAGEVQRVVIDGVFESGGAASAFEADGSIDVNVFREAVTKAATSMVSKKPAIGAILLETSFFAPYSDAVHKKTGLPVFDFVTLIDELHRATHRYQGKVN